MDLSSARLSVPRALGAAVLLGGVLVGLPLLASVDRPPSGRNGTAYAGTLKPFGSCDTVLRYFKDQAPEYLISSAGGYARTDVAGGGAVPVSSGAAPQRDTGAESGGTPPVPMYRAKLAQADMAAAPEETYQTGEMKFSASVNAEYDLIPAP